MEQTTIPTISYVDAQDIDSNYPQPNQLTTRYNNQTLATTQIDRYTPREASNSRQQASQREITPNLSLTVKIRAENLSTEMVSGSDFKQRTTNEQYNTILPFQNYNLYVSQGNVEYHNFNKFIKLPVYLKVRGTASFYNSNLKKMPNYLHTTNHLILDNNEHIRDLSQCYFNVENNFNISGSTDLEYLPENMSLGGAFIAKECLRLKNIPKNLKYINKGLDLSGCYSLTDFPPELEIKGSFNGEYLHSLKTLKDNRLIIQGNANFDDNKQLESFPEKTGDFAVSGNLYAQYCKNLKNLSPETFHCSGSIYLNNSGIVTYPENWTLSGDVLSLSSCKDLVELAGDHKVITAKLFMLECLSLHKLPNHLEVGSKNVTSNPSENMGIRIKQFENFNTLPSMQQNSSVDETVFYLSMASNLKKLPDTLIVNGSFKGEELTGLQEISGCMKIYGNLSLAGNNQLILTDELNFGCANSASNNETGIYVNGDIDLSNCSSITSLPESLLQIGHRLDGTIRTINLQNTGLSQEYIAYLQQNKHNYSGIKCIFSTGACVNQYNFSTLEQAIQFWEQLAGTEHDPIIIENLHLQVSRGRALDQKTEDIEVEENQNCIGKFVEFLSAVTGTADYSNISTQKYLATKLVSILKRIVKLDNDNKRYVYASVTNATESCEDRVAKTIDDLFMVVNIREAFQEAVISKNVDRLKSIAPTVMIHQIIERGILRYINQAKNSGGVIIDEVQVSIQITTEIFKRFDIETVTKNFKDIEKASVNEEFIIKIYEEAKTAVSNPNNVESFLAEWDIWNQCLRIINWPKYKNLKVHLVNEIDYCAITYKKNKQMVIDLNHNSQYTYTAFKDIYISTGINPYTKQKIDITRVCRLELKKTTPNYKDLPIYCTSNNINPCMLTWENSEKMVIYRDSPSMFYIFSALIDHISQYKERPYASPDKDPYNLLCRVVQVDKNIVIPEYESLAIVCVEQIYDCAITGEDPRNNIMVMVKNQPYSHYKYDRFVAMLYEDNKLANFDWNTVARLAANRSKLANR